MAENFLQLMKYLYPQIKEPSPKIPSTVPLSPLGHVVTKVLDTKTNRILKCNLREQITDRKIADRLTATSLVITIEAKCFRIMLRENNCWSRILHLVRLSFKNKYEIKIFFRQNCVFLSHFIS